MPVRPETLDDCFRKGARAREKHRTLAANPYDIETDEHREWAAGWSATFDLDEDQDPASMRIDAGETADTHASSIDSNAKRLRVLRR